MGPYLLFFFSKHNFFILFFFFRKSIRDSTKEIVQKMKFKVKFAIALIAFAMILKNSQGCCHTVSRCFGTPSRHQPNSYARTLLISSWDKLKKKKKKTGSGWKCAWDIKRRFDDTSPKNRYKRAKKNLQKKQHDNNGNEIVEADVSGEYTAQTKRAGKNENPMENFANVI